MKVNCAECGTAFERELPSDLGEPWRSKLEQLPAMCPACSDDEERARALDEQERDEQERLAQLERRRKACELPALLQGLSWDELDVAGREPPIAAGQRWSRSELAGLVLLGSVGVGKTRIAATATWALLEREPVHWLSVPVLFARLGLSFGAPQRERSIGVLTGTDALVLDDLDKARASAYAAEQLFLAIDGRVSAGAPLLVTTNSTPSEIAVRFPESFGDAISSRLVGYCERFRVNGPDRRLQGPA